MKPQVIEETRNWVAINKPPNLVVHDVPGNKHAGSTLVDWLRRQIPEINDNFESADERPGIVHRLDADTSGIILVAKNPNSLKELQTQFKERTTIKKYWALVLGTPPAQGTITGDIVRKSSDTKHEIKRLSFSWDKKAAKMAETSYKVLKTYQSNFSLLEVQPKTGRTHQIRVHLSEEGWPIIGDQLYCNKESRQASAELDLKRQFLHAKKLEFNDPESKERITIQAQLAPDLEQILKRLE
ncbi:RluA family pseudouridine synthase [Candidatus Berkelbacteria bacterium]|nr:RluA family pseudouridine synthase [Candidatus Berkelbacteria bacterium]